MKNEIASLISQGYSLTSMAVALNKPVADITHIIESDKELLALYTGKSAEAIHAVENALYRSAIGCEYDEEHEKDGEITRIHRTVQPNPRAAMDYLSNRNKTEWKKTPEDREASEAALDKICNALSGFLGVDGVDDDTGGEK